jgi:transposase
MEEFDMSRTHKTPDFSKQRLIIGIDVHKNQWTATFRMSGIKLRTETMNPDPDGLHRYVTKRYPGAEYVSAYESGFCGFWIHRKLVKRGIKNLVFNAADIPTKDKEKKHKRDRIDSLKIARELENGSLDAIYVPDEMHQHLRSYCRLRHQYSKKCTRVKNQTKAHLHFNGIKIPRHDEMSHWSGAFIKWLKGVEFSHPPGKEVLLSHIEELEFYRMKIAKTIRTLRRYAKEYGCEKTISYLRSVPGIGFIIAITLYCEVIDINRFRRFDQFASFFGFIPGVHASDEKEYNTGIISRYNRYLRYLIIEAAWMAVRQDPVLTLKFAKLCKRMKKQEAIIRIAKKLLSRIYFVWKNQQMYVPNVVQ